MTLDGIRSENDERKDRADELFKRIVDYVNPHDSTCCCLDCFCKQLDKAAADIKRKVNR